MIQPEKGKHYWNPWIAGIALGIVVTVAFAAGRYFGASRVFATLARFLKGDDVSLEHWMSWELVGILIGGFLGAVLARRFRFGVEKGSRIGTGPRLALAVVGGVLVMFGSRLAAGCTSGLALSGGIRMSTGAFIFMGAMFAAGFLAAAVARRIWS